MHICISRLQKAFAQMDNACSYHVLFLHASSTQERVIIHINYSATAIGNFEQNVSECRLRIRMQ